MYRGIAFRGQGLSNQTRCAPRMAAAPGGDRATSMQIFLWFGAVGVLTAIAVGPGALAADFYQGKTLTVIVGYAPGGGVDTTARAVTRHLGRFIPGNPAVTVQNMEGAAGIVSVNHLVRRVAPDGLTLAIPGRSWFIEGIVKRQGVAFDPVTLTYVGSPGSVTSAVFIRSATGITTIDGWKASGKTVTFGALGAGTHTATVPSLLAAAGAPAKIVLGYVSTARILLALEQGEVDASFTTGDGLANRPALAKQVTPIVQSGARFPGLPLLRDVVLPQHHSVLELAMATDNFGVPIVGPPGVPAEQTTILRKAFLAMAQDKDYQADAQRVELPVGSPIEGGQLADMMRALAASTTPAVIAAFNKLVTGK
jgi:tripartite-type tricarboxylate transporter receptor subunit TctC